VYQISYLTALLFQTRAHVPGARPFDPAEPVILAIFATAAALLLANLRAAPPAGSVA
jgi:phosphatidylserine decarboxylase